MIKDIEFYNKESASYSEKRYLGTVNNFIKFFFKKRLGLFTSFIKAELDAGLPDKNDLLDIGCADGFVMNEAYSLSPDRFAHLVGIDTSPEMIQIARETYPSTKFPYFFDIRGREENKKFDIIVELGIPLSDWRSEFAYVSAHLKDGGVYILSTPGSKNSLYSRLKKDFHIDNPLTFSEFDALVGEFFDVVQSQKYAFFVPKLWAFPVLARIIQPVVEVLFQWIFPSFYHEKMYVLKKKNGVATNQIIKKPRHHLVGKFFLLTRYLISGFLAFLTNFLIFLTLKNFLHVWYLLASTIAFIISVVASFLLQKYLTFRDKTQDGVSGQMVLYCMIALFNVVANGIIVFLCVEKLHISSLLSQVLSAGIIAIWSFVVYRFFIFKNAQLH